MERNPLVNDVIQAVQAFNDRKLWQRFTNFHCFAVRVPEYNDPLVASVMGDAGEQFGLLMFRGPRAAEAFEALISGSAPDNDLIEAMDMLGFSMEPFGEMNPEAQDFFRKAGVHPKVHEQLPGFIVKPSARLARLPHDSELRLLLAVLKAAVWADRRHLLKPAGLDDDAGVCVLTIDSAKPDATPSVDRERLSLNPPGSGLRIPAVPAIDLSAIERVDATWLVGAPSLPVGVANDDRSMRLLLIVEGAGTSILQGTPYFADEIEAALDLLFQTIHDCGVPGSIVFTSRSLYDAAVEPLEAAGAACIYEPSHPVLEELASSFLEHLGAGVPSFGEFMGGEPAPDALPAPDDLTGWKQADFQLSQRFADHLSNGDRPSQPRAIKRYFQSDDLESFFHRHQQQGVVMAYSSWCMLDYRPTKKSKTHAEVMLAEGLPPAEEVLLRARMATPPSLHRVAGHDPAAGTLELEDVLLGGTATVHDRLMSENIESGLFLAGRAFPAGDFHFFEVIGPPLGVGMGWDAVAYLRECKLEPTPQGLRQEAHKLGWLWAWIDRWQANYRPPRLCNTDGDDLLLHTVSFAVDDPAAVRSAFDEREDVEFDEQADEFVWFKESEPNKRMMGDTITLGRIEMIGDELVLSVNSVERFAMARDWLTQLPGVRLLGVQTREAGPSDMAPPLDDQMQDDQPLEMTPELINSLQVRITEHYMDWLDMALPVLGGRSPRQACRTPEGREHVKTMIRTMPDPAGDAPIRIPRQAMLHELGLAASTVARSLSTGPEEAVQPPHAASVGRNDPCPCGSGRKYKKCCGG